MSEQETEGIAPAVRAQRRVDRWFYIGVALLMIVLNVIAFAPSIIDPSMRKAPLPLTPLVTAHAIVSAAWLVLFLAQATLVATRNVAAHRRIGMFGVALTVLFIVVGSFSVIGQARRGFDLSGDIDRLSAAPDAIRAAGTVGLLFLFLNFAIVAGAGLCYRHRPAVHKRLMLLALLGGLTTTPVAHVVGHWAALQPWAGVIFPISAIVFLSTSAIHDRVSEGRIHPVSIGVPVLWFVWQLVFGLVILPSAMWQQFAAWLIR
jgi:uncharacterized membrane protein YozB (DUF420 family)